jgi:hypothetical protein
MTAKKSVMCSLLLILLIGGNMLPGSAQNDDNDVNRNWKNEVFGVGERLIFDLDYSFVTAGRTVMSIDSIVEVEGYKCYRLVSTVSSNKTFDLIFKVRDRVETNIDITGIFSRRYYKQLQEGKYKDNKEVFYDQEKGKARVYKDKVLKKVSKIEPCSQDILSSLFFFRTLDLEVGDTINVNLYDVSKSYPLKVKVNRRERIKVPAGTFDCLVVEPFLESEGMFRSKGKIELWLTDDQRKIPVQMRTYILLIGHIDARLREYTSGEPLEISE